MKVRILNEKCMLMCVFFISIATMILIMMNLPADVQRVVNSESKLMHRVFIPENVNNQVNHEESHQHPAPPLFNVVQSLNDDNVQSLNDDKKSVDYEIPDVIIKDNNNLVDPQREIPMNIEDKREFIKKVSRHFLSKFTL